MGRSSGLRLRSRGFGAAEDEGFLPDGFDPGTWGNTESGVTYYGGSSADDTATVIEESPDETTFTSSTGSLEELAADGGEGDPGAVGSTLGSGPFGTWGPGVVSAEAGKAAGEAAAKAAGSGGGTGPSGGGKGKVVPAPPPTPKVEDEEGFFSSTGGKIVIGLVVAAVLGATTYGVVRYARKRKGKGGR